MDILALILIIVGALNWGLVGLFQFDLIATLFGGSAGVISRILYAIVGIAGLWGLTLIGKLRREDERINDHHHRD